MVDFYGKCRYIPYMDPMVYYNQCIYIYMYMHVVQFFVSYMHVLNNKLCLHVLITWKTESTIL